MALNFLHFNENKTEVLILGPSGASDSPHMHLCSLEPNERPTEKHLGVIMDSDFKLVEPINSAVKSIFFQPRLLS